MTRKMESTSTVDATEKILAYLKCGTVRGENEKTVYAKLSGDLKIDIDEIEKSIAVLSRRGLVLTCRFTSYSPITKTTSEGFEITLQKPRLRHTKEPEKVKKRTLEQIHQESEKNAENHQFLFQ